MSSEPRVDDFYAQLGQSVKRLRTHHRLTQAQLAAYLGLTRPSVANIESGRQRLMTHQVATLAQLFDVKLDELLPVLELEAEDHEDDIDSRNEAIAEFFMTARR